MIDKIIRSHITGYLDFLKSKSNEERIDNKTTKLTYPFLDSIEDCTEIFIIEHGDKKFTITDNGETLVNLRFNGVEIKGDNRIQVFNKILNTYGVKDDDSSLLVEADEADLYLKKHMLLQCIMKINDMYVLSRANVQNIFLDDVKSFFDANKVRYVPNHKITGMSGLLATYDFAVPKSEKIPLTLVKVINKLDKDKVKSLIFDWNDTKSNLEQANLMVVFNDNEISVKKDIVEALNKYGIENVPWSKKQEITKLAG